MIAEPDSPLAKAAFEQAKEILTPSIYAHSARAFLLGAAAGDAIGVPFDRELLYVAALLHDIGFAHEPQPDRSFEIIGAELARQLVDAHRPADAQAVWNAIVAHTVPHIARAWGAESLLLHLGSAADAFGARLPLASDAIAEIEARYPRLNFQAEMIEVMERHAAVMPYGQLSAFRALGLTPRGA